MVVAILIICLAYYWLLNETNYLRVRLLIGVESKPLELQRISWGACQSRYRVLKLSIGVDEPLCGWDWLESRTHPIPQVTVDINSGGVRYHWDIKDTVILNDAIKSLHARRPKLGYTKYKRNKLGGLVAALPAKVR